jgi:predicted DNA-binding protein YlxM (UPF0122 family)
LVDAEYKTTTEDEEKTFFQQPNYASIQHHPIGRECLRVHIGKFIDDMASLNMSKLQDQFRQMNRQVKGQLSEIGRKREEPKHVFLQWSRRVDLRKLRDGQLGESGSLIKKVKEGIFETFPTTFPVELDPQDVSKRLEEVSGTSMSFLVGCEDVLRHYVKEAVDSLDPDVEEWLTAIATTLTKVLHLPLVDPRFVIEACRKAGDKIASDVVTNVTPRFDDVNTKLRASLTELHQNPRVLNEREIAISLRANRVKPLLNVQAALNNNDLNLARTLLTSAITATNYEEATVTIDKIKMYWTKKMESMREVAANELETLITAIHDEIERNLTEFTEYELVSESEEQGRRRAVLLDLEDALTKALKC